MIELMDHEIPSELNKVRFEVKKKLMSIALTFQLCVFNPDFISTAFVFMHNLV